MNGKLAKLTPPHESCHTEFKWVTSNTIESCLVHILIPHSHHYERATCETHPTTWVMSHRIQMSHVKHNRVMSRTHSDICTRRVRETHPTKWVMPKRFQICHVTLNRIMSQKNWMSHVTHKREKSYTHSNTCTQEVCETRPTMAALQKWAEPAHQWVVSHTSMSHDTHKWVKVHTTTSHGTHRQRSKNEQNLQSNESCHKYEWVISHISISRVAYIYESWHT